MLKTSCSKQWQPKTDACGSAKGDFTDVKLRGGRVTVAAGGQGGEAEGVEGEPEGSSLALADSEGTRVEGLDGLLAGAGVRRLGGAHED